VGRAGVSIEDAVALIISVKKINRAQETGWIFYVTSKLIFGVLKLRPNIWKKKWTDPSVNCWWTVSQQLAESLPTDSWQSTDKWKYELSEGSFMLQTPLFHGSFHCESLLFFFTLKPPILGSRIQQEYFSNSSTLPWNKCIIQIAW